MNLIQDVVVKTIQIRADARFLERVNAQTDDQIIIGVAIFTGGDKRVNVSRIGGWIKGDERSVHVAGRAGGEWQQQRRSRGERGCNWTN